MLPTRQVSVRRSSSPRSVRISFALTEKTQPVIPAMVRTRAEARRAIFAVIPKRMRISCGQSEAARPAPTGVRGEQRGNGDVGMAWGGSRAGQALVFASGL